MGAKKIQPTEYETALALVEPFQCVDVTRQHIALPFSAELWGRSYVCATDGHTAAAVACAERVARSAGIAPPPPLSAVFPDNADRVGFFLYDELEALRGLPAKWNAFVDFTPSQPPRLTATRVKRIGKKNETIKIVTGAALEFKNAIDVSTAINVGHLLRAVDFCGVANVTVWRERGGKLSERNPLIFTCGVGSYMGEASRVAIVMPTAK